MAYSAATPVTKTFQVVPDFTVSVSGAKTITIDPAETATFSFALAMKKGRCAIFHAYRAIARSTISPIIWL